MTSTASAFVTRLHNGGAAASMGPADQILPDLLAAVRSHLGMDVAFVSQFEGRRRVFKYVDSAPDARVIEPGQSDPLDDSYCQRVVDGRLPQLIANAQELPAARALPGPQGRPVGAHISVPILLRDGSVYGTLCCFGFEPDSTLRDTHVDLMRVLADVARGFIEREVEAQRAQADKRRRIQSVLEGDALFMVYQPIKDLRSGRIVGLEALARFAAQPTRGPDAWFAEAAQAGLGQDLEIRALEKALRALHAVPHDTYVSCNLSPEVVLRSDLDSVLQGLPLDRVLLEVTEHATVSDYAELARALRPLRERGLRLAVDDAGAGYASFRHILSLDPDVIKLDLSLTRDIDTDPGRRALATALITFAVETGRSLVAEGVETAAELATLRALGVHTVQGYFIGRPSGLDDALRAATA
jgi:EAL domain-containing protein (putative c-di-GMP-specific phosphodiesterase class I)